MVDKKPYIAIESRVVCSNPRIFWAYPCFLLDVFISFCSISKGLSNEIKTSLDQNKLAAFDARLHQIMSTNIHYMGRSHVKKTGKNRIFVDFLMIKNRLKWDDYNQVLIRFII